MSTPPHTQEPQPAKRLMQFAAGCMVSAALFTTTQLSMADLPKGGAKSTQELATGCGAQEDAIAAKHAGDFFSAVPASDAYFLKNIIHDGSQEKALKILKICHTAARGNAKVVLVECVLTPGTNRTSASGWTWRCSGSPGDARRLERDLARLLDAAGFTLTRVVPKKSAACVIEAEKRS